MAPVFCMCLTQQVPNFVALGRCIVDKIMELNLQMVNVVDQPRLNEPRNQRVLATFDVDFD